MRLGVSLEHLRTHDGRKVDPLARLPSGGYLAFEMKVSDRAVPQDARHMKELELSLGEPVYGGLVVYTGDTVEFLGDRLYAVPASVLFS